MSKITIIEGNSDDKDKVRALMVKGEPGNDGVSPTIETSKTGSVSTVTFTDAEGTHSITVNDGELQQSDLDTALADYKLKGDFAILTGEHNVAANSSYAVEKNYPDGFNSDNTLIIGVLLSNAYNGGYQFGAVHVSATEDTQGNLVYSGWRNPSITLNPTKLIINIYNETNNVVVFHYKIVLMKVS